MPEDKNNRINAYTRFIHNAVISIGGAEFHALGEEKNTDYETYNEGFEFGKIQARKEILDDLLSFIEGEIIEIPKYTGTTKIEAQAYLEIANETGFYNKALDKVAEYIKEKQ